MAGTDLLREVDRNYDYFMRHMAEYLPQEFGRYALLRDQKLIAFFDRADEAERRGEAFGDGLYSIQLVDPEPVHMGAYSNA